MTKQDTGFKSLGRIPNNHPSFAVPRLLSLFLGSSLVGIKQKGKALFFYFTHFYVVTIIVTDNKTRKGKVYVWNEITNYTCIVCLGRTAIYKVSSWCQPPSLFFFVQSNNPSMLCNLFIDAFSTHSSTLDRKLLLFVSCSRNSACFS